jgi:flagellar hook protein FlgE
MLGSMYSAVSGLSAHQTKMNVIGNNIANVNTYGFKSSRVTFSDVFYQTMNGASEPTENSGGTNPIELGYGAKVKSIDVINTRAGSATTDRPLDVYINGDGYLPVKDSNGIIKYTRVGVLSFDVAGNLVDSTGNMVLGVPLNPGTNVAMLNADGTVNVQDLVPIKVTPSDLDKFTGITIGSNGEITAIKEGDPIMVPTANTAWLLGTDIATSSLYQGGVVMTATRSDEISFFSGTYKDSTRIAAGAISVSPDADINGALKMSYNQATEEYSLIYKRIAGGDDIVITAQVDPLTDIVTFSLDPDNPDITVTVKVGDNIDTDLLLDPDEPAISIGNAVASEMTVYATTYDKSGAEVELKAVWQADMDNREIVLGDMVFSIDPQRFGTLRSNALNETLIGIVGPGAGEPLKIANIALVKFINSDGLSQNGEGYYLETGNSGKPVGTIPGNGGTGTIRAGALEMSNVDLSREFTEMIIAQRGFQANTRMITVSDEMLSELANMKR